MTQLLDELAEIVQPSDLIVDREALGRHLRDNSWLSPVLAKHIDQMTAMHGTWLNVDAIAAPRSVAELAGCAAAAYCHDVPITVVGAGTSNFGQTVPLDGGLVIHTRHLAALGAVATDRVTAQAGTVVDDVDRAARARGLALTVLTTTYATATCGGWVAGGHVGLGTGTFGTIWDGNVLGARVLTVEEQPREIDLAGAELDHVLHAYGTTGVLTEVTLRVVPACEWVEAVGVFGDFEAASRCVGELARRDDVVQRVVAAQEAPVPQVMPLGGLVGAGESAVLMIVDADGAATCRLAVDAHGGRYVPWGGRPTLGYMVYGHRMLWVKKLAPDAAFLHCYFDPDDVLEQMRELKQQFGDDLLMELKYMRSRRLRELYGLEGDGVIPAPVLCIVPGSTTMLAQVMEACTQSGVTYQNPHTFALEESGLFPRLDALRAFKRRVDPKGLLNPGKLDAAPAEEGQEACT